MPISRRKDKEAVVHIYTMEYYSAMKNNSSESVLMRWMKLEPMIQSGLPCPPPEDLRDPGIEPSSPVSSVLQVDSLLLSHRVSPIWT